MNLDTLASSAEIIGLITILGAAVYSWFQIKEMKASLGVNEESSPAT